MEADFVASDVFRSGTVTFALWRGLHAEQEYFGTPDVDVGITGLSWKFRWKKLAVSPGFAVGYGRNATISPVFTIRWALDTHRWFSQGFWAQDLTAQRERFEEGVVKSIRSAILDNNHFSVRVWKLEAGPLWEHIVYREENEWKGGARIAGRLGKHWKLIFHCVAPKVEYRGGIAFER